MVDQTLPEIREVQEKNKAVKYQKDKFNKIIELAKMLDLEHISKLHKEIEKLYLHKFRITDHFKEFKGKK